MKSELFRGKSLKRISSPERIDECIKVIDVRLWLVGVACLVFIFALAVWGIFGKIEITDRAVTVCENGKAICFVSEKNKAEIYEKTEFRIGDKVYELKSVSDTPQKACEAMPEYAAHLARFKKEDWVYAVTIDENSKDGIYETEVLTLAVSPLRLLFN